MAGDLQGMLECCICAEDFKDPRMLPCIHTFCLECLEKTGHDKQPGETMPCPLCRTEFKIPDEGFKSIAKNFFIEKLLNMHTSSVSHRCDAADACLDNSANDEIPPAVLFCVECEQKLCDMCSQWHKKTKATKQHQLIDVNDKTASNQMARNFSKSFCSKHETEVMEIYCWDCNMTLCWICYEDVHQQHKCSSAKKVGEEFRLELVTSISKIPAIRSRIENEVSKHMDRKRSILDKSSKLESEVLEHAANMKDIIDQHAKNLLVEILSVKLSVLKDLQNEIEELNRNLVMLETFGQYVTEFKERGSAMDICRNFQEISARCNELEKSDIFSKKSDMGIMGCSTTFIPQLGNFLKMCENVVGRLQFEKQLELKTTPDVAAENPVSILDDSIKNLQPRSSIQRQPTNIGEIHLQLDEELLDQLCEVAMGQIASELNITLKRSETGNKSWILVGPSDKITNITENIKNFLENKPYTRETQEDDKVVDNNVKVLDSDTECVLSWEWLSKAILHFYFHCGEFVEVNGKECVLKGSYDMIEGCVCNMKSWIRNFRKEKGSKNEEECNTGNIEFEQRNEQQRDSRKRRTDLATKKTHRSTPFDDKNEQNFSDLDIEKHVWLYMLVKYGIKISTISVNNSCSIGPVENEKKHCIRFKPSPLGNMDKAMDEFASLYREVDGKGIVKCSLPITNIVKTEEMLLKREVYFSFDCEVICPRAEMEEIKRIVANVSGIVYPGKTNPNISNNPSTEAEVFYEFDTPSGIHVKISQGNLVRQRTVAIVSPVNERLGNGGGAARAIEDAAGYDLRRECDEFINRYGKLPTTEVTHTCGGKLPCVYVVHAVGPDSHSFRYKDNRGLVYDDLKKTFYNCFHYANSKTEKDLGKGTIKSISIPAISSGIYGVPKERVANAAFDALMKFDEYYQNSPKYLREINFVNNDEPTVMAMMNVFRSRNEKCESRHEKDGLGSSFDEPMKNSAARNSQKNVTEPDRDCLQLKKDYKGARPKEKRKLIYPSVEDGYEKLSELELDDMRKQGNESKKNELLKGHGTANPGKEDNYCVICMDSITDPVNLPCKHKFCRKCLDGYKAKCQPKCPSCGIPYGEMKGDQPKGTMNVRDLHWQLLSGFEKYGTLEISYHFPGGTQKNNHPEPGKPYKGTSYIAYLPANKEGREVLELLRRAFENDILFTVGRSNTTEMEYVVIWNDVHHKTSLNGPYGYPDPTYLTRVKEELAAKGIRPK